MTSWGLVLLVLFVVLGLRRSDEARARKVVLAAAAVVAGSVCLGVV